MRRVTRRRLGLLGAWLLAGGLLLLLARALHALAWLQIQALTR